MVRVKICGLNTVEQAVGAAGAGADFIGVVFAPGRRHVSIPQARAIAEAARSTGRPVEIVGVFVNMPPDEVNGIARECGLDRVQLSGDESMDYCVGIEKPVIKAVRVGIKMPALEADSGVLYLLDTHIEGHYGGTGKTFDWSLAQNLSRRFPIMLAGGLSPNNVAQAVREVKPWGVDVSSGVETDGVKDMKKIRAFIEAARRADDGNT